MLSYKLRVQLHLLQVEILKNLPTPKLRLSQILVATFVLVVL